MSIALPRAVKPFVDLVIQVAVGALGFSLILLIAVLVAGFVKLVGTLGFAPEWLSSPADRIEQGIFWFDIGCLILFLIAEAIRFIKGLWKEVIQS